MGKSFYAAARFNDIEPGGKSHFRFSDKDKPQNIRFCWSGRSSKNESERNCDDALFFVSPGRIDEGLRSVVGESMDFVSRPPTPKFRNSRGTAIYDTPSNAMELVCSTPLEVLRR
jgi:hypothetical protein